MDEAGFNALADAGTQGASEGLLDACGPDFDYEVKPGGDARSWSSTTAARSSSIATAAREIWLAAKSGLSFPPRRWCAGWARRDGEDFYVVLSRCMSEQAGEPVSLKG